MSPVYPRWISIALLAVLGSNVIAAEHGPLPRSRPSFAQAAEHHFDTGTSKTRPTECDQRLAAVAAIKLLPTLVGPGACGGDDMVRLGAVLLPDDNRVQIEPAAVLRCGMAESFATWIRDVSGRIAALGAPLRGVQNYDSYECRPRNRIPGAKLSEHAKGDAIDVRAFVLAGGRHIELSDRTVPDPLREQLRAAACHLFSTVLGPGADRYHTGHVHLDNLVRKHGYRICEWDVREPPSSGSEVVKVHVRQAASEVGERKSPDAQNVTIGPWVLATNYKAGEFESCSISRSAGDLAITFVQTQDGLQLHLVSPKWKLDRGAAYSVRLVAGSRSVKAKALAETKSVTIALADDRLDSKLRSSDTLEVRGEGATLRVPLNDSARAFEQLEACFSKSEALETNPFVGREAHQKNPFVRRHHER
jgi:Extensin-like protein C-terminus